MNISYGQIEDYCNEMHALANNMKSTLDEIIASSNKLSSSGSWTGDASEFYQSKIKKLTNNFDEVFIELENSILFLANSAEGYKAIDEKVIREICNNLNIMEPSLVTSKIYS
jgi:Uncharacterized protein conserved in bacteria